MAKKNPKETLKRLRQEAQQRTISDISGRLSFLRSSIAQRVTSFVPVQFRWLIPFLIEELDIKAPTLDDIKSKFTGKTGEQELTPSEIEENKKAEAALGISESEQAIYSVLPPKAQIQAHRGRYQVESFLGYRGRGRFYQAISLPDRQPLVLKEYLLPKSKFSASEITRRKENFERLAAIELADGRVQDFRVLTAWDAKADLNPERESCYLVIKNELYTAPSLGSYINKTGAMTNIEVREVLDQVLQSLQFLHNQKFRLSSGLVESGLPHGNLRLDNLLIVPNFQGFFIYLCDLALWEEQFIPGQEKNLNPSPQQDLTDLGKIAFYLLVGSDQLDPTKEEDWHDCSKANPELKKFILQLINSGFNTAEAARQSLPKSNRLLEYEFDTTQAQTQPKSQKKWYQSRLLMFSGLGVLLLGLLIWFGSFRNKEKEAIANEINENSIAEVSGIPNGKFSYTSEVDGVWHYVMNEPNLLPGGATLKTKLQQLAPKLELDYVPYRSLVPDVSSPSSVLDVLSTVTAPQRSFVITSLDSNINPELGYKEFAYDGLVVFVAFSKKGREYSLPPALNGKISFEQLQQLYTGKITSWKQLGGPDIAVKLYIPPSEEAVRIFEQRVLKTKEAIDEFRSLIAQNESAQGCSTLNTISRCQTSETFRSIIKDFENNKQPIGSIGFASLSKVFGQCSVYPLALVERNSAAISPLLQKNGKFISPQTELCNDKGNYTPNFKDLMNQRYPLAYPLAVVYARDNRREPVGEKFGDILRTNEVQCLLQETGVVPLQLVKPGTKKAIACVDIRRRI